MPSCESRLFQRTGPSTRNAVAVFCLALFCLAHTAGQNPPYALDTPLTAPRIFASGVISTATDEFGASFTPDGQTVYFSKSVPSNNLYVICYSQFEHGRWSEPNVAPFSGRYFDFDSFISPDGTKMLFASDRPLPGTNSSDYNIWMVEKTASGWGEPTPLPTPINTDKDEVFASIASDGTIYFNSDRDGPKRIYRSRLAGKKYGEPERLASLEQPGMLLWEVSVAPDQSALALGALRRSGGLGLFDIYISFNRDGTWTAPINLGPKVNTATRDYSPRISPDGKYLFYSSERGFATEPLMRRLSYDELQNELHSIANGWGNILQIDLAPLEQQALQSLKEQAR